MALTVDDLIEELEEVKNQHGDIEVGINYEAFAYSDLVNLDVGDEEKLWLVAGR